MARRVLFAALLVFGPDFAVWQIQLVMYSSFAVLLFLLTHGIWKEQLVKRMHIVNEIVLIFLCLFLIQSTPGVYPDFNRGNVPVRAYLVIVLVTAYIVFNLVTILYDLYHHWLKLHCIRRSNIITFRVKYRHNLKLLNQRNYMMAKRLRELREEDRIKGKTMQHLSYVKELESKFKMRE